MSSEARRAIRQDQSAPKIIKLKAWLTHHRTRVSARSPLGEALKYIAKYWAGLCLFFANSRIELDNSIVERAIRRIALNRKNTLFANHDAGAANWATIASLAETYKLNAIKPHAYLTATHRAVVSVTVRSDCRYLKFHGSRSLIRLILWSGMRARVLASQAWGSTPLILAVSISV